MLQIKCAIKQFKCKLKDQQSYLSKILANKINWGLWDFSGPASLSLPSSQTTSKKCIQDQLTIIVRSSNSIPTHFSKLDPENWIFSPIFLILINYEQLPILLLHFYNYCNYVSLLNLRKEHFNRIVRNKSSLWDYHGNSWCCHNLMMSSQQLMMSCTPFIQFWSNFRKMSVFDKKFSF